MRALGVIMHDGASARSPGGTLPELGTRASYLSVSESGTGGSYTMHTNSWVLTLSTGYGTQLFRKETYKSPLSNVLVGGTSRDLAGQSKVKRPFTCTVPISRNNCNAAVTLL